MPHMMIKTLTKSDFFFVHFPLLLVCLLMIVITWLRGADVAFAIATAIYVVVFRFMVLGLLRLKHRLDAGKKLHRKTPA
jgi:hypothetical protein